MPAIVLEARDFASPLFWVRTWEVSSICVAFSLLASVKNEAELSTFPYLNTFRIFCMFSWCFFFTLTLLIHVLSIIQFHSLFPISWKNLTMTAAVWGALMTLSTSVVFPWIVMNRQKVWPRPVSIAVASCLAALAYVAESLLLRTQEQRGYMGSLPGLLKILQLWGGCQMMPMVAEVVVRAPNGEHHWPLLMTCVSYGIGLLMSLVTLVVILGDFTGRCFLRFDRILAVFSLTGVLLYMLNTVMCFTKILHLRDLGGKDPSRSIEMVMWETVVSSVTLLAYTVDVAFSIKLLCDRSHM